MKSDTEQDLDEAQIKASKTEVSGPSEADPYQVETMVMQRKDAAGQAELNALLETHLMSRSALKDTQVLPRAVMAKMKQQREEAAAPRAPVTMSDMLVPAHIRRQAAAQLPEADPSPLTLKDPGNVDLLVALGVRQADADAAPKNFIDTLLIWLMELVGERRDESCLPQFCDILLRLAEEVAEQGLAGLAALTMRYRRALQHLDADGVDPAELGVGLLEWATLVAAHVNAPEDAYCVEALVNHVQQADVESDTDVHGYNRLHALLIAEARTQSGGPAIDEKLIVHAGDSVFHAGRAFVFVESLVRRLERLQTETEAALSMDFTPDGNAGKAALATLRGMQRRLNELYQTALDHRDLSRVQHAELAALGQLKARDAFAALEHGVHAAAQARRQAINFTLEGGEVRVDEEAASVLGDPLHEMAHWMALHGTVHPPSPDSETPADFSVSYVRRRQTLRIVLRSNGDWLGPLVNQMRVSGDALNDALARELMRLAVEGEAGDPSVGAFANRFEALNQAVTALGGHCQLRHHGTAGMDLELDVPGWLTKTMGRLVPAGGGVLTVRETGVDRLVDVDRKSLLGSEEQQRITIDGQRYPAFWLLTLLGLPQGGDTQDMLSVTAMISRAGGAQFAVLAAGVSEPLSFSVRGLTERLPRVPGVVGGTVLVGGEISPLIDLPTVIQAYLRDRQRTTGA